MKLATYKDGSRDGQLVVVARDLSTAHYASQIAGHMRQLLDDWNFIAPQLQDLYDALNAGRARHAFPFDPRQCMAPLPRTGLLARGQAWHGGWPDEAGDPALALAAADGLAGPCDPLPCGAEPWQMDFGAGLAVVTADLPLRASPAQALDGVRLLLLSNAVRLHAEGLAPVQRLPLAAFGPVAATPDEFGDAWDHGRVHLSLRTAWNGRRLGLADTAAGMRWHFGELAARLCATRALAAGSIVCGGTVRSPGERQGGERLRWPHGAHALADQRAIEALRDGQAATGFLRLGDTVHIEARAHDGQSVFGAIEQEVVPVADGAAAAPVRNGSPLQ
ncbi:fumarylacetoacetate hydrolase family protein [Pseudorhodoferax sp.]|uniref:fumarylacetoacetate hydrolase family protein n=1 Tax=Pseudorhodoferax sp. TaxID=1993553 RepID=UPI0039E24271